jgi:peptide/nickel transport system permease protein
LELVFLTMIFTVVFGVTMGVASAVWRNSPFDYAMRFVAILWLSIPAFWIATLVLLIPVEEWDYSPPLGQTIGLTEEAEDPNALGAPWDNFRQFGPPALVLGLAAAAGVMRLTRSAMLNVLRSDYIRTARAKGLRERLVVWRHAIKNSLIPVVTVLGLELAGLLGGAVLIETVFTINGIGSYTLLAIVRNDFLVVQSIALYLAAIVVLLNLVVDISYAWLDPRIRYS